jgi:hypothetical protein
MAGLLAWAAAVFHLDQRSAGMTYPPELQAYYDAHDEMMDAHRGHWPGEMRFINKYKIARYNAVKAGYLPEQPEFR